MISVTETSALMYYSLKFIFDVFGDCSELFPFYRSLHFKFPLVANVREVGYNPVDLKLLNNMYNCSQMSTKLLGKSLLVFTVNMLLSFQSPSLHVIDFHFSTFIVTKQHNDYVSGF